MRRRCAGLVANAMAPVVPEPAIPFVALQSLGVWRADDSSVAKAIAGYPPASDERDRLLDGR